jgi:selenocysteine lyase/cysteine desulfurase
LRIFGAKSRNSARRGANPKWPRRLAFVLLGDENLSAGMICFDVKGMKQEQVVERLLAQRIVASTTPYRVSYARLACNIVNTPQEIDTVLRATCDLA